ncbi:MAG: TAXI family TRAP transporter solute-binding subunit [Proteobacteria bacterium]|nr:TAXI family TRAP transporter solute-binding subunit [Pseudomonadota bacterium]MBU1417031.1 TAXI family TRAP transporter solute-binding subunit [Pseudomonadota bacterium]MBU1453727.1 TAXI family TRAP transporter solute-binding subunit [Pseudomonadota bacterium]
MRTVSLFLTLLITLLSSSSCFAKTFFVTIGTGEMTGIYYSTGGAITRILNQSQDDFQIKAIAEPTSGAVFNINAILGGHLLFGLTQSDRQYQAVYGEADWMTKGPQKNLRSVFSLYPEIVTLIAAADSGIKTVSDLRGKKVNIGKLGSGYRQNAIDAITAAGLDIHRDLTVFTYNITQANLMLQSGKIDAFFYTVGHPNISSNEATSGSRKVTFVAIPVTDAFLADKPYYTKAVIPIANYPASTNKEEVESFGVKAGLVTSGKVSEEIVYTVTKQIFENFEFFKKLNPVYSYLSKEEMIKGNPAPLHPGALKYYQEIGLLP